MDTEKDFNNWNLEKKLTHLSNKRITFYEREIWWAKIGVNIGVEIDGKHELSLRPVILLRKFNKDMVLIVPTTGNQKPDRYRISVSGEQGKIYYACLSQIRTVSAKRFFRKVDRIDKYNYNYLISAVVKMIERKVIYNGTPH